MIENELRSLLADRADSVRDNPDRIADVRSRIRTVRRRRTAGAALALVVLALAGAVLAQLPGRPETLPAGAPAGPYFGADGTPRPVTGYLGSTYFAFQGSAAWAFPADYPPGPAVVVARCERRGDLTLRDLTGPGTEQRLSCRVPVGDHFEGALPLADGQAAARTVPVRAGSTGDWMVGRLQPLYPQRLTAANVRGSVIDGFSSPAGGAVTVTLSSDVQFGRGVHVMVACVRGVRLQLTLAGRDAGVLACDDRSAKAFGLVDHAIPDPVVAGLRPGQRVVLQVRPLGPRNDQWAVIGVS